MPVLLPGLSRGFGAALVVRDLSVAIETPAGELRPVRGVSWSVAPGETLAIVGGKRFRQVADRACRPGPSAARCRPVGGAAVLGDQELLRLDEAALRRLRGNDVAMVFQDPMSSLNPVHRIGTQITEAIRAHRPVSPRLAWKQAVALLEKVGISDAARRARAFPHELSGGMRQRAMIAMAIANRPKLLIADEPTTALDVTIQAQVLDLLATLKADYAMGLVFITHSLPVVSEIADRVVVMYAGEVVEHGPVADIFARPLHPYTAALLRCAPADDGTMPEAIPGSVPLPHLLPSGCAFAPRCADRRDACEIAPPSLEPAILGRETRCIRWRELTAQPVAQGADA